LPIGDRRMMNLMDLKQDLQLLGLMVSPINFS
jgi:hypothetical protein